MKLTYVKKKIQRKTDLYTIIIPDNISGFINNRYILDADRNGLNSILLSVLLMLKEKNTIIFFSLQKNILSDRYLPNKHLDFKSEKIICDVVFAHHAMQMPISDWKEIRQSFRYIKSVRESLKIDVNFEYEIYKNEYEKFKQTNNFHKNKDVFYIYNRFDTYFIVGGHFSFMDVFIRLKDMLDLPLEEKFKEGKYFDYICLCSKGYENEFVEFGFFDKSPVKQRCENDGLFL